MSTNIFCANLLSTPRGPGHPGRIPGTSQLHALQSPDPKADLCALFFFLEDFLTKRSIPSKWTRRIWVANCCLPPWRPWRTPDKQTVGTVTASDKILTLQALSSSLSAGTAKRGCLGQGKAFWQSVPQNDRVHLHILEKIRRLPRLSEFQKNPRVRKNFVRNSGAGNGCANFMGAWKNASVPQEEKPCP